MFGNTDSLFKTFATHGVDVTFVDTTDVANVEAAIQENTRLVFVETIANPCTQVSDLARIGALCRKHNLVYFVDNTLTTPYLFLPKKVDASLIINSLTKYIGGHGNVLGGAITDTGLYDWSQFPNLYDYYKKDDPKTWGLLQIRKKGLRDFGASLGPDAAHQIALGAETLALRMERSCANAQDLATFLSEHEAVKKVYYPGLRGHPQYNLTGNLFSLSRRIIVFRVARRYRLVRMHESLQRGRAGQQSGGQSDVGDPRLAYNLLRNGSRAPRQHGYRRVAHSIIGGNRRSRRPESGTFNKHWTRLLIANNRYWPTDFPA